MSRMERSVRTVVFPAAGLGTRFLPATKVLPKEMLVLVDKPIIQYGVEEALESGIDSVILVTSRGKGVMEDHFDVAFELETMLERRGKTEQLEAIRHLSKRIRVSSVRQGEPLGLGHAVLMAKDLVGDQPFAVVLPDDVIDATPPVLRQMIDVFERVGGPVIAVERVPPEDVSSYGVVAIDQTNLGPGVHRIVDLVEKPPRDKAPSNLAIIGRYILTPDIFEILERTQPGKNGEVQITDALLQQARDGCVIAYKFKGRRFDCGTVDGYVAATNYCYRRFFGGETKHEVVSIAQRS
jgi:UTP--glucose-1-phosphate uridylyltransferase